jgi:hypothetical protein
MPSLLSRGLHAVLLTILLVGCGGGGSGATQSPAIPPVSAPPVVAPSPPIPATAWNAPANAVPATGNDVYLQSDSGDYIGSGRTYTYTGKTAILGVLAIGTKISLSVAGDQGWSGSVALPSSITALQTGYFKDLTRAPFADPAKGGLEWSGKGRG